MTDAASATLLGGDAGESSGLPQCEMMDVLMGVLSTMSVSAEGGDAHTSAHTRAHTHTHAHAHVDVCNPNVAAHMDRVDALAHMRDRFCFPPTPATALYRTPGSRSVYLCGNSLGLAPTHTRAAVCEELDKWAEYGVEGHFRTARPWMSVEDTVTEDSAAVVGAHREEVAVMNTLTTNLHLLMAAFFKPTATRTKILMEQHAFPSDTYAVKSQLSMHGLNPAEHLIEVAPRAGEDLLRDADILDAIRGAGDSLALVLFTGVQYYTGQFFDLPAIAATAHEVGALVGIDLAHAVGNVPLQLHAWEIDFAAWCSYKYLNSGPGGIAGVFVHARYANVSMAERPHYAGWWGHQRSDRFKMGPDFVPIPGAGRFQLSNPPVLQTAALRASLELFKEAGFMQPLRAKSLALTAYLEALIRSELAHEVAIITPADPARRGCQLSLVFTRPVREISERLSREGVIVDVREPHVMRVAPTPLYCSAADVLEFITTLKMVLAELT